MFEKVNDANRAVWGDYQLVDHDYDTLAADPTSETPSPPIGNLASLMALQDLGGITTVRSDIVHTLVELLQASTAVQPVRHGPTGIELVAHTAPGGALWIDDLVARGYAILIDVPQARLGRGHFVVCQIPGVVAQLTRRPHPGAPTPASYALLAAPAGMLEMAMQVVRGGGS
jgi:hypothetical protein